MDKLRADMDESYKKTLSCFDKVSVFAVDPREKIRAQARQAIFLLESETATEELKEQARETLKRCIREGDGDSYACWFVINDELARTKDITDELKLKINQLRRLPGGKKRLLYLYSEYKDDANTAFVSKLEETLASMEAPNCAYEQGLKFREMGLRCIDDTEKNGYLQKAKQYFLIATRSDYYLDDDGLSSHDLSFEELTGNNAAFQWFLDLVLYEIFFASSEISSERFDNWRRGTYKIHWELVKPDSLPPSLFKSIGTELMLGNHLVSFLIGIAMLPKCFRKLDEMDRMEIRLSDTQWGFLSFLSNCVPGSVEWPQPRKIFAALAEAHFTSFCRVAEQILGNLDSPQYAADHLTRKLREEFQRLVCCFVKDDSPRFDTPEGMRSLPQRIRRMLQTSISESWNTTIIHKLWEFLVSDFGVYANKRGESQFFILAIKPNASYFSDSHTVLTTKGNEYFDQLTLLTRKFAGGFDVTEDARKLEGQYCSKDSSAPRPGHST